MRVHSALLILLACGLGACAATAPKPLPHTDAATCSERRVHRLLFGMNSPSGPIGEAQWQGFLSEVVTPRFPDGLTVYDTYGQWRGGSGQVEREASRAVEIVHDGDPATLARIAAIAAEYKRRYRQEAVLAISHPATACFY